MIRYNFALIDTTRNRIVCQSGMTCDGELSARQISKEVSKLFQKAVAKELGLETENLSIVTWREGQVPLSVLYAQNAEALCKRGRAR